MLSKRVIPCLDVRAGRLTKGIKFQGNVDIGDPVESARRYYEEGDERVLPRSIASFEAFENAMSLDIAMGGSTNTILHLLAAAHEAGVEFGLDEIDAISRRVPCLAKVASVVSPAAVRGVSGMRRCTTRCRR